MRNRLMILGAVAAVVVWGACSSSTAPTPSSGIGTWHVTVNRMVFVDVGITDTLDVRPAPFAIEVQDTGSATSAVLPTLYGLDAQGDTVITWGFGNATAVTVSGDSIHVVFDNGNETCLLEVLGTFHGTSASGTAGVSCADSVISGGSWTATKS